MMPKEILITIGTDGSVEVEAVGYTGKDCLNATKPYEEALGVITHRKPKPVILQESDENEVGGSGVSKKLGIF